MLGRWFRVAALGAFSLLSVVGLSGKSYAGDKWAPDDAWCGKNADGSGFCSFSYLGVRNNASTTDWVDVTYWSSGVGSGPYGAFVANVGNTYYTCNVSSGPLLDQWPTVMRSRQWVQVDWNKNGTCTDFGLTNSSTDDNF